MAKATNTLKKGTGAPGTDLAAAADMLLTTRAVLDHPNTVTRAQRPHFGTLSTDAERSATTAIPTVRQLNMAAFVLSATRGRPFLINNVATLQFRTHIVSALFSVFDRVATGGFADSLIRQFIRLRHLVQDGGPRILNSSRSTEAVDRLRSFIVGYSRPEHALLHPSELLFCTQVEVFLGERDLRDKEWQVVPPGPHIVPG